MLDKSLPYVDIFMRRPAGAAIPDAPLAEGYRFALYRPGDECAWARIETSVAEFAGEMDALLYFQKNFLPFGEELPRRCTFIEGPDGEKIATATAWWGYDGVRREPLVHWVAVRPEHQGKGLGKALIAHLLRLMVAIEGDRDFALHTQTWSHVAVGMYEKYGFQILREPTVHGRPNDRAEDAVQILREVRQKNEGR